MVWLCGGVGGSGVGDDYDSGGVGGDDGVVIGGGVTVVVGL